MELTAHIVASYVSNNTLPSEALGGLIATVNAAIRGLAQPAPAAEPAAPTPAVPVRKSVQPDFIVCLEDGKKFKSLKRHLRTAYGMSPDDYRAKWGLPPDYPMVAPNYAKVRSELAKTIGLGQQRKAPPPPKAAGRAKTARSAKAE